MTESSLEDTKAQVPRPRAACIHCHHVIELSPPLEGRPVPTWVHIATGWVPCSLSAEPPRAASVVPAEPATHDTPLFKGNGIDLDEWLADQSTPDLVMMNVVVYRVAAVDGEAPAT